MRELNNKYQTGFSKIKSGGVYATFLHYFGSFKIKIFNILPEIKIYSNKIFEFCAGAFFFGSMVFSLFLVSEFDQSALDFQKVYVYTIIEKYNLTVEFGVDGISICFLVLTTSIMTICWMAAWTVRKNHKESVIYLILINLFLILSFTVLDIFFFYVFFESVLIPMFLIIGLWGSRARKIKAAYYLFLYTLFGSLFMLFGILYIYAVTGTTNLEILLSLEFSNNQQICLWICFFLPFAIKIPMFPFHI
ncbi:hypothetical protein EON73_03200 [bacterium]|nr:MAG: hypothetical protein EON73_03200 [bacterium]